jgi:hypothetical protein
MSLRVKTPTIWPAEFTSGQKALIFVILQRSLHFFQGHSVREHQCVRAHDLAHQKYFQRIYGVFPAQVETPTGDFFGKDRGLHGECGERVSDGAADHQWQKNICVVR